MKTFFHIYWCKKLWPNYPIGVKHEKAVNMRPKEMFEESLGIHGNFQTDAETVKQIDIYKLRRNLPTQI